MTGFVFCIGNLQRFANFAAARLAMAHRTPESKLSDAEWETLRTSVALVCRDGLRRPFETDTKWVKMERVLLLLGRRAQSTGKGDLALSLLVDFADAEIRKLAVDQARKLVARLPERELRKMTKEAAEIVDRKYPEQAFRFRATLALVAMFAGGELR